MTTTLTRPGGCTADQIADAKRQDPLRFLAEMRSWSRTSGGELHGPCPKCRGKDRMICWPNHPHGQRALCRQCAPLAMDTIALVQWLGKATSFPEAVRYLIGDTLPPPAALVPPLPPATPRPYRPPPAGQQVVDRYNYAGFPVDHPVLTWQKERREPGFGDKTKTFYARRPRPGVLTPRNDCPDDWYEGREIAHEDLLPYNWPAVLRAPDGAPILWCDGERDVKTARRAGLIAICGPDGGDSWQERWGPLFVNHPALVIPDGTPDGPAQAERAARLISPYADSLKIVPVPAKDLSAWAAALATEGASHAR